VDVCLYFIAAHRLKQIDIRFMQAISRYVSVIPIIAKADRCATHSLSGRECLCRATHSLRRSRVPLSYGATPRARHIWRLAPVLMVVVAAVAA
jgi:hypothetical protein